MRQRISQLRSLMAMRKIDAYWITHDINISYLTGFPASESSLLITPSKIFYITDSRYTHEARLGLKSNAQVVEFKQSPYVTLFDLAKKVKANMIGLDDTQISYAQYKKLKRICPKSLKILCVNGLVEELRIIKDKKEMDAVRDALVLHAQALKYIKRYIKVGVSERSIMERLENFIRKNKVEFSFDPIVASGPNSAFPHASVTERKLKQNEPLLLDMGIKVKGYMSDLTRMFVLGKMQPRFQEVIAAVRDAQKEAINQIRPGQKAGAIDNAAREVLKSHNLHTFFGHSLGHGVGQEIHEDPKISPKSGAIIQKGMVFTVEPGVYFPGEFGVRLEEMILVTAKGCEVLSDHIH